MMLEVEGLVVGNHLHMVNGSYFQCLVIGRFAASG
jgi:hypothetical protein